jgi:hypothetical protein
MLYANELAFGSEDEVNTAVLSALNSENKITKDEFQSLGRRILLTTSDGVFVDDELFKKFVEMGRSKRFIPRIVGEDAETIYYE